LSWQYLRKTVLPGHISEQIGPSAPGTQRAAFTKVIWIPMLGTFGSLGIIDTNARPFIPSASLTRKEETSKLFAQH
jgi:hypothetical protein